MEKRNFAPKSNRFLHAAKVIQVQNVVTAKKPTFRQATAVSLIDVGAAAFLLNKFSLPAKVDAKANGERGQICSAEDAAEIEQNAARTRGIKAAVIHVLLILSLIIYSFIGAAVFQALEKQAAKEVRINLVEAKARLIENIWVASFNHSDKANWTATLSQMLSVYDKKIVDAALHGIDVTNQSQYEQNVTFDDGQEWDLWDGLFYAATIYTTIGYGHLIPITAGGRIATMIYALIGIPLCLVVLADLGGLLSELIKHIMRSCKVCIYKCRTKKTGHDVIPPEDVEHLSGLSVVACLVVICVVYLFVGAAIYTLWETEWSYLESFYFLFISFSTIGFGDILPSHPRFFLLTFVYIFLGLALLSTGLTVIQQALRSSINIAKDQLDAKLGLETSSVDDEKEGVNLVNITQSSESLVH